MAEMISVREAGRALEDNGAESIDPCARTEKSQERKSRGNAG